MPERTIGIDTAFLSKKERETMLRKAEIIMALLLCISVFGLSGCGSGSPLPPLSVELSFPHGAPYLNQTTELRCLIEAHDITNDLTIIIKLPDGFELVSGDLSWTGDLPRDGKKEIKANIKAKQRGNWTITAVITISPDNSWYIEEGGGIYSIYVAVSENHSEWGAYPPWIPPATSDNVGDRPTPPSISPDEK